MVSGTSSLWPPTAGSWWKSSLSSSSSSFSLSSSWPDDDQLFSRGRERRKIRENSCQLENLKLCDNASYDWYLLRSPYWYTSGPIAEMECFLVIMKGCLYFLTFFLTVFIESKRGRILESGQYRIGDTTVFGKVSCYYCMLIVGC